METISNPGKTTAMISYLTFIGWIVALIMNTNNKNSLASYHIRQSLGIQLLYVATSIVITITGIGLFVIFYFAVLALVIIGIINANNEEEKPLPFVGEHFQKWFKGL